MTKEQTPGQLDIFSGPESNDIADEPEESGDSEPKEATGKGKRAKARQRAENLRVALHIEMNPEKKGQPELFPLHQVLREDPKKKRNKRKT